jgi:hypothetical protein
MGSREGWERGEEVGLEFRGFEKKNGRERKAVGNRDF